VGSGTGVDRATDAQEADVLLLDEPTNAPGYSNAGDMEESLLEFTGALLLVTHDRYLLDRVSTIVWGWMDEEARNVSRIIRSGMRGRGNTLRREGHC